MNFCPIREVSFVDTRFHIEIEGKDDGETAMHMINFHENVFLKPITMYMYSDCMPMNEKKFRLKK